MSRCRSRTATGRRAQLTAAPLWVPVDLRDGNQALAEPMDPARKRRFFELMVAMGYKEIEVGYPSASQTDFDFVRSLARTGQVPTDVTIVVFTAARRDLIERTVESVRGIPNPVVIHVYTATAPIWRDVVLGRDRAELKDLILTAGRDVLDAERRSCRTCGSSSRPEVFNLTEPDYVLDVCDAMTDALGRHARTTGDPEPAGDGRDRDAERVRRPDRVHAPQPRRVERA